MWIIFNMRLGYLIIKKLKLKKKTDITKAWLVICFNSPNDSYVSQFWTLFRNVSVFFPVWRLYTHQAIQHLFFRAEECLITSIIFVFGTLNLERHSTCIYKTAAWPHPWTLHDPPDGPSRRARPLVALEVLGKVEPWAGRGGQVGTKQWKPAYKNDIEFPQPLQYYVSGCTVQKIDQWSEAR